MRIAHPTGLAVAVVLQLVLVSSYTTPVPAAVTRAPTSPPKLNPWHPTWAAESGLADSRQRFVE